MHVQNYPEHGGVASWHVAHACGVPHARKNMAHVEWCASCLRPCTSSISLRGVKAHRLLARERCGIGQGRTRRPLPHEPNLLLYDGLVCVFVAHGNRAVGELADERFVATKGVQHASAERDLSKRGSGEGGVPSSIL